MWKILQNVSPEKKWLKQIRQGESVSKREVKQSHRKLQIKVMEQN